MIFLLLLVLTHPEIALAQQQNQVDSLDQTQLKKEIGQMLMVGIRGTDLDAPGMKMTRDMIVEQRIGGIIFFKHNIKNRKQFQRFVTSIHAIPSTLPLLLAVDEEGGAVRRLSKKRGFKESPSAAYIGSNMSPQEAYGVYRKMAEQIHSLGLNLNLAPVVDVNVNLTSPAIGRLNRSFSSDPSTVYDFSSQFIAAHRATDVLTALKHYPGHGSSREDTHNELTDITSTWTNAEQAPFKRLIEANKVDMIMAGHLFDNGLDKKYPASLSRIHIQEILRDSLGYEGVVITDDLQMGAIIKLYELDDIVVAGLNAGCDILQFSDPQDLDGNLPDRIYEIIIAAIQDGRLTEDRIHESYHRIVSLKDRLHSDN